MVRQECHVRLGVSHDAGIDEIKRAYHRLSMQYHPDHNPGDKEAEEKFKEIGEAYAVLRCGHQHSASARASGKGGGARRSGFPWARRTAAPAETVDGMFRRWLANHCHADAVALWEAVASDQSGLSGLPMAVAERLVGDAEEYIRKLAPVFEDACPDDSPASAAMYVVSQSILAWRRRRASAQVPGDGLPPAFFGCLNRDTLKEALGTYPQFSETNGAKTLAAVVSLGARGLARMLHPLDRVTALGASRHVARAYRGDLNGAAPTVADVRTVISSVQEYTAMTGRSPWETDAVHGGGSVGPRGNQAAQAFRLARDAAACADIAAGMPDNGVASRGFGVWADGEEVHSFRAMALDRSMLKEMLYDDALRFASSALKRANSLAAARDGIHDIDGLPPDAVTSVISAARAILPDGPRHRPWERGPNRAA